MEASIFLNKRCKLVLVNNFTLRGVIIDVDQFGVVLQTTQKTGYHSFANIKELSLENKDG